MSQDKELIDGICDIVEQASLKDTHTGRIRITEDGVNHIIKLVRDSEWVSVEDELPEDGIHVLVTQFRYMDKSKGRYQIISYRVKDEWFEDDTNDIPESVFTPTHWMPLPSPPTNKGGE